MVVRPLLVLGLCSVSACAAPDQGLARAPGCAARCAGRFAFCPPTGLPESRSEFMIYGTSAHAELLAGRAPSALWDQTVSRREAQRRTDDPPLTFFELAPGVPGLVAELQGTAHVEVLRTTGRSALWLTRSFPRDRLPSAQKLLRNIANAFSEATGQDFCLGEAGSIGLSSQNEVARVRYVLPGASDFSLELYTLTVQRPSSDGQDLDLERDFARSTDSRLTVERDRSVGVAGQVGKEVWLTISVPGHPTLVRRTFSTRGEPGNAARPHLQLRAKARAEDAEVLARAWAEILDSLRTVPSGGG